MRKPNPDALFQKLGNEVVLVNLKTDRIFELNETAARLWELLVEGKDLESIEKELAEEFAVDSAGLRVEIERTLVLMEKEQLLLPPDE